MSLLATGPNPAIKLSVLFVSPHNWSKTWILLLYIYHGDYRWNSRPCNTAKMLVARKATGCPIYRRSIVFVTMGTKRHIKLLHLKYVKRIASYTHITIACVTLLPLHIRFYNLTSRSKCFATGEHALRFLVAKIITTSIHSSSDHRRFSRHVNGHVLPKNNPGKHMFCHRGQVSEILQITCQAWLSTGRCQVVRSKVQSISKIG